jgi:hypothetical protein
MKGRICLVALCSLIFHCSAAYGQTPKKDDRSAEWEYKQLNNPPDDLLNHHAKDGWEIAAAAGAGGDGSGYYKIFLKRSKSHPLFWTQTAEMPRPEPPPPPQKPACKMTLAQAPVIRGLRLGMTSDELFAIFPANEHEEFDRAQQLRSAELPPKYGHTFFDLYTSKYPTKDQFTGIGNIRFDLFDKKVVSIIANYTNTPQFDSAGQLMEIITRHFGLPEYKGGPRSEYWNGTSLSCEGFRFQVSGLSGAFSIVLTDPTYKKIMEDRVQADRAKTREGFKL